MTILPRAFYEQEDVVDLARQLLGKWLITKIDGTLTGGMIIETEAYKGAEDKASHAYGNRRTKRTEVIFARGGVAYVYLCYGMHNLFNIVTNKQDTPHAILIRALKPDLGIETMQKRRKTSHNLTSGPGMVCQALGITRKENGHPLTEAPLWIEERGVKGQIESSARIGISYAREHASLPWRFLLNFYE
ncbi:MAG: putative 3-methyladenine DNA glycosylase [Chlamydiae bacterium]|nr:putative 3-methyladenine DNA glycosylase [Chlamydiota bacterium]